MWNKAFKNFEVIWSAYADYITSNFFKGCPPQILLGPFLNTLTCMIFSVQLLLLTSRKSFKTQTVAFPNGNESNTLRKKEEWKVFQDLREKIWSRKVYLTERNGIFYKVKTNAKLNEPILQTITIYIPLESKRSVCKTYRIPYMA